MLKFAEIEIVGREMIEVDGFFLGSCFLSNRTDIGVKLAALRASMA